MAGAHVVCVARTLGDLDQLVSEVRADGGMATAVPADVRDEASVEALFGRVDEVGGLDLALLNAGGLPARGPIDGSKLSDWAATLDLNVTGAYLCARAAIPRLRARGGGKIILVGSGLGHRGSPQFAAYACAKAAQWMLTRVLAQELLNDAISVNELIPGPVDTSIGVGRFDAATFPQEWAKRPEDVVPMALMLATYPNRGPTAQSFSLLRRDD